MIEEYVISYKIVSRGLLDRGEVGGYEKCEVKSSLKEAEDFIGQFMSRATYKGLSYSEKDKLDNIPILLYHKIQRRVLLFDLKDFVPRMRCIKEPSKLPTSYKVHAQAIKFKPHPLIGSKDGGYYCSNSNSLKEAWKIMKNKNNKNAQLYAYYECK